MKNFKKKTKRKQNYTVNVELYLKKRYERGGSLKHDENEKMIKY